MKYPHHDLDSIMYWAEKRIALSIMNYMYVPVQKCLNVQSNYLAGKILRVNGNVLLNDTQPCDQPLYQKPCQVAGLSRAFCMHTYTLPLAFE